MSACGLGTLDINNDSDRMAMIYKARSALSAMDCASSLKTTTELFNSKFVDNDIRMLHASAYACSVGIQLYPLIDEIAAADFSNLNAMIQSFVRIFPSRTLLDTKLQSAWYAQDVLQSMVTPGTVISASDQNVINAFNTGSLLYRDRTEDSNSFLIFLSMAGIGTSLNRYGYGPSDDPAALGYTQVLPLAWTTMLAVKNDTSHAGCSLASSLLNLFDGIAAIQSITSGPLNATFTQIVSFQNAIQAFANTRCTVTDGFSVAQCGLAAQRLRYRDACFETDPVASYASGIISAIDTGWL